MIAIIDYGMGNLRSVQKGFEKVGHEAVITSDPTTIDAAERVVLPGVGAFGDAMHELRERGLVDVTRRAAHSGRPFLGICLGLQLLFDVSYEGGRYEGLGILAGEVVRFAPREGFKVPHMGWNELSVRQPAPLFAGLSAVALHVLRTLLLRRSERSPGHRGRSQLSATLCGRRVRATIFSQRSSIPRRAKATGCTS